MNQEDKERFANQDTLVLDYMKKNGSITSLQSVDDLGIHRLAACICRLRRTMDIDTEMIKVKNRFGEDCRVGRYTIVEKKGQLNLF